MATAAKTRSVKFTYEDYLLFPEDGRRREIIDGELYNADIALGRSPSLKHQRTSANLLETLNAFVRPDGVGMIVQAPFDVVFPNENVVQPDLSFVSTARVSIIAKKCIQGPPDLIVEILAEETWRLDETIKRKLYERHGVPEYWIVDPELETVKVFRMTDQGYVRAAELSRESGDALSTPLLPGLAVPLADIFEQPPPFQLDFAGLPSYIVRHERDAHDPPRQRSRTHAG
ncbi:MAG: Uma2 family endonuclease [Nitrospirae bacterium]|nr:Uma2 family endonuclease [Nitrospirota bacterium]